MAARVLIVEDDSELRSIIGRGLREEGLDVTTAGDARGALAALDRRPDAVVLDIGLPDGDGRDLCQALRAAGMESPIIFLTARDAVPDRLAGFNAGGDDYLIKPFAFDELLVRLRALLRRAGWDAATRIHSVRLDPVSHALVGESGRVALTPTEFRILAALAARPGQAVRRRELVASAWPPGAIVHDNTLDVYVGRLRRKLRALEGAPEIATVHAVGYRVG